MPDGPEKDALMAELALKKKEAALVAEAERIANMPDGPEKCAAQAALDAKTAELRSSEVAALEDRIANMPDGPEKDALMAELAKKKTEAALAAEEARIANMPDGPEKDALMAELAKKKTEAILAAEEARIANMPEGPEKDAAMAALKLKQEQAALEAEAAESFGPGSKVGKDAEALASKMEAGNPFAEFSAEEEALDAMEDGSPEKVAAQKALALKKAEAMGLVVTNLENEIAGLLNKLDDMPEGPEKEAMKARLEELQKELDAAKNTGAMTAKASHILDLPIEEQHGALANLEPVPRLGVVTVMDASSQKFLIGALAPEKASLKKLLPDGMKKQATASVTGHMQEMKDIDASEEEWKAKQGQNKEQRAQYDRKRKKALLKYEHCAKRFETLTMMSEEQRAIALDALQMDVYEHEVEAFWVARLEPEMEIETTPEQLYKLLKVAFAHDFLEVRHVCILLRHLYTNLGGHIPEGEILVDKMGVLSPIEGPIEDEISRIIQSYFGAASLGVDGKIDFIQFIRLLSVKPVKYILPDEYQDPTLALFLFQDEEWNYDLKEAKRRGAQEGGDRDWNEVGAFDGEDPEIKAKVLKAYDHAVSIFDDADVDHNKYLDAEELAEVLFAFGKKLGRHTEFVLAIGVDINAVVAKSEIDIKRFGVEGKGVKFAGFLRCLSQAQYQKFLPPDMQNLMNFVYLHHLKMTGGLSDGNLAEEALEPILEKVEAIFKEVDLNRDGTLDEAELLALVRRLRKQFELPADEQLGTLVQEAVKKFSLNGHDLSYDEFLVMLGYKPWIKILPVETHDAIIHLSAIKRTAGKAKTREPVPKDQHIITAAKRIFFEADTDDDGYLTSQELITLYQNLCERLGVEEEEDYTETIRGQVGKGENEKGQGIPYPVFSRLICGPLWRELFPEDLRTAMRFLTLKTFKDGHLSVIHQEQKQAAAEERRAVKAAEKEAERAKKKEASKSKPKTESTP